MFQIDECVPRRVPVHPYQQGTHQHRPEVRVAERAVPGRAVVQPEDGGRETEEPGTAEAPAPGRDDGLLVVDTQVTVKESAAPPPRGAGCSAFFGYLNIQVWKISASILNP